MGVWIETVKLLFQAYTRLVTPFVGVWIETVSLPPLLSTWQSHPSWVCGLKHFLPYIYISVDLSHPSWVCGLKLAYHRRW